MSSTCLIQSASGGYRMAQARVHRWHSDYCQDHDIDYLCHLGRVPSQREKHPVWDRLPLIESAMDLGYNQVACFDSDVLVVNPHISLLEAFEGFKHVGMVRHPHPFDDQDWHFNMGVMFLKNTPETREFLRQTHFVKPIEKPLWELQSSMLTVNKRMKIIERVSDKWNATEGVNDDVSIPVIRAWHGQGVIGLTKLLHLLTVLEQERDGSESDLNS